jgi:hypothetical protein
MSVPSKKITSSNDFFTEKIKLEQALIDFEKLILEGDAFLQIIESALANMQSLAEENKSAYFLQRVKKLHVFFHSLKLHKGYSKDDFDPMHHVLEKIKNEDRIEFLDSALKNRISKIAKNLSPEKSEQTKDLANKEIFTAFKVGGVYFLIPKRPYRILKNIPAFKSSMSFNKIKVPLFPGPGFLISENEKESKKNVLLIQSTSSKQEGFYYDELLEDWAITKDSIKGMMKEEKGNQKVIGKIRRKGINYHVLKLV